MFGHFTIVGQENKSELLTINKKKMELHSWIRRAASKVTIAYDGSGLEDGVFIYLKSVTIKDIPQKCYLGKNNPAAPEDLKDGDEGVKLDLIPEGETIKYYKGDGELSPSDFNETYEARITKGNLYSAVRDMRKTHITPKTWRMCIPNLPTLFIL